MWAIEQTGSRERVIITCNQNINNSLLEDFDKQILEAEPFVSPKTENNDSARNTEVVDGKSENTSDGIPESNLEEQLSDLKKN
ncbi:MAG: hypothetical protein QNJ74_16570 [Trichodesmium sp. MO_231.B1]|nr:hypothetical protein [Trichodesmium sp. MO_231.B1]